MAVSAPPEIVTFPDLTYTAVGPVTEPPAIVSVPPSGLKMPAPFVEETTAPSLIVIVVGELPLLPLPAIAASALPEAVLETVPFTTSSMPPAFFPNAEIA